MAASGVDGVLCPFCSIFHRFRQHFGRNSAYFFTNVVLELFYGPWLVNVNLWLQISPQEEVRRRGQSKSPLFDIKRPGNNFFRKSIVMRLVCGGAPSCWNQNCRIRFRRIIGITRLVIMEEKRPNDRFRTNAAPNCDFFVMKRHFLNLLRIFSGVNTAILLINGPIIRLTLQTRYVIKRSGISVKRYCVARWVRRIWTTLY